MMQIITEGELANNVWLLFLSMWIGVFIYFSVRTLIPHCGRLYMLESGSSKPDDFWNIIVCH